MQTINFPVILIFAFLTTAVADDLSAQNKKKSKKRAGEKVQEVQDGNTQIERAMRRLDKNGDARISRDEAPEAMLERFDRMDANGDDVIDEQEIRLLAQRLRASGERNRGDSKKRLNAKGNSKQASEKSNRKKKRGKAADRENSMELDDSMEMNEPAKPKDRPSAKTDRMNPAALLRRLDKNKDQQVSKDEVPKRLQAAWDRVDTNKNQILDPDEMQMLQRLMSRNKGNPKNNQQAEGSARGGIVPKRPGS